MSAAERWSIVLAGGRGTRLAALTTVAGETIPKQYCTLGDGPSMLRRALRRATSVAGTDRALVVVAAAQRRWWEPELCELPADNVLVQPCDRGTAAGLLLPLAEILRRAPDAVVTVVPADHHIEREPQMRKALVRAASAAQHGTRPVVLVGVTPTELDADLGWIVPAPARPTAQAAGWRARPVARFCEKPTLAEAARLAAGGAVVNTFLFAARARSLWAACELLVPDVTSPLAAGQAACTEAIYETLPTRDFSKAVLERAPELLGAVAATGCGWSDLGTPERVVRCLRGLPSRRETSAVAAALDLSLQMSSLSPASIAG